MTKRFSIVAVFLLSLSANGQLIKSGPNSKDKKHLRFIQETNAELNLLTSLGKLREAKELMVDRRLPNNPLRTDYQVIAMLSFELADESETFSYWETYIEKRRLSSPYASSEKAGDDLLLVVMKAHFANKPVSYQAYKEQHEGVSVREELIKLTNFATGNFHFRRARILIHELERWKVPDSIMNILRKKLSVKLEEQRRLIGPLG